MNYVWMIIFALIITACFGGVIVAFIMHFWIALGAMFLMLSTFFILALRAKENEIE